MSNAIHFGEKMSFKKNQISKKVLDLIYDKQHEFTKEKSRKVSLERTLERLLQEAYIDKKVKA